MSCFINNKWVLGDGTNFNSMDPFELNTVWKGEEASLEQSKEAVDAAREAWKTWRKLSVNERLVYLEKYTVLVEKNKQDLAELISREMGKPLWESLTEVQAMIGKLKISCQAHNERCSDKESMIGDAKSRTRFHPIGVCLVLGPFNLPAHLPNGHIVPALLAGNTIIFKPSEKTPAVGEYIVKLLDEANIPKGVVQLLQGGSDLSQELVHLNGIDIIAFTGSNKAGVAIHKSCAGKPEKMLALEMGGNNPLVIWEPADLKAAAYQTILSSFITSGQRCVCARRLILPQGELGDGLLEELKQQIKSIKVKAWDDKEEGFMGPLIDAYAGESVLQIQEKSVQSGAICHVKAQAINEHKAFVTPSLLEWKDIDKYNSIIGDEETFGPLLQVFRSDNFEEAIYLANQTKYGLSAGLISKNKDCWVEFQESIRAGIINWNRQMTGAFSTAPFGGVGKSGNYRPSAYLAADYCSYPSSRIEVENLTFPSTPMKGLEDIQHDS